MGLYLTATLESGERRWPLEESPVRVGRASGSTVQLLDGTVSKSHAELTLDGERWLVRDLGSRNGTRVNGRDAVAPIPIAAGDRLEIGHVYLTVAADVPGPAGFSTSDFVGTSLSLKVSDILQHPGGDRTGSERLLHLVAEAGQLLVLPRPLPETCERLLEFVEKAVPARRLVILLRDPETGQLSQTAARFRGGRVDEPLALSQTILGHVLAENTAVITGNATLDPRFLGQHSVIAQAIHSAMAVPLFDNEKVLGVLYIDSTNPGITYGQPELELLTLLGNMAAVKITNARLLVAEATRVRLLQELATATRIQQNMLPDSPALPGWRCHARIETCFEVGGDLYDFHRRADGTLVVLAGDVSGKGMGAALLMSSTLWSARVLYDACEGPLDLVRRLNAVMHRSRGSVSFVTLFAGWLDPLTGRLRYVNAGHPEPHLVNAGEVATLAATGIPLGMLDTFDWIECETVVAPGALLALFSDGLPEAQHGDDFFDLERLGAALLEAAGVPELAQASDGVIARVDTFAAGEPRADDVTLVLLRRE